MFKYHIQIELDSKTKVHDNVDNYKFDSAIDIFSITSGILTTYYNMRKVISITIFKNIIEENDND